jgi:hypothetical protein
MPLQLELPEGTDYLSRANDVSNLKIINESVAVYNVKIFGATGDGQPMMSQRFRRRLMRYRIPEVSFFSRLVPIG